jgi:hypothetical protein
VSAPGPAAKEVRSSTSPRATTYAVLPMNFTDVGDYAATTVVVWSGLTRKSAPVFGSAGEPS